ncbi:MAG: hypothetical protein ACK54C_06445 [Betaproteobacteria bacterium]
MKIPFSAMSGAQAERELARGYVCTTVFDGVTDVFDAEALWAQPKMFRSDPSRLRGFIERNLVLMGARQQAHASVILELPAVAVTDDERIFEGAKSAALARHLAELHQASFGDLLPRAEPPRYSVLPGPDLAPDQVRARIGHAIYVPASDEEVAWQVRASPDGVTWDTAPTVLLTERQRLTILGGDAQTCSHVLAGWPFGAAVALVLVNQPGKDELTLGAEPLDGLKIVRRDDLGCFEVRDAHAPLQAEARLYLRTVRQTPVTVPAAPARRVVATTAHGRPPTAPAARPPRREPVGLPPAAAEEPPLLAPDEAPSAGGDEPVAGPATATDSNGTLIPQPSLPQDAEGSNRTLLADEMPDDGPMAMLELLGLAVQRPSRFRSHGVRGLRWGLDAQGNVVSPGASDWKLRFSVDAEDRVRVATAHGERALAAGEVLPLPGGGTVKLEELPPPLNALYLGWMALPAGRAERLREGEEIAVGRDMQQLAAIKPLAGGGFVSAEHDIAGDRMGMSRQHFKLRVGPDGLLVQALGRNTVEHLDTRMNRIGTIAADAPAVLADGQYLVVSHYVWRYREADTDARCV